VSSFKDTLETKSKIDYQVIANGWHKIYYDNGNMETDLSLLEEHGYEILKFKCKSTSNLYKMINDHFKFPDYFHHNLDSLADCLEDINIKGIGMAIVFKNMDNLNEIDVINFLDIFINLARLKFIIGKRLLILAHVNDKDFRAG
jgi:RNAse (barnase) inhibitor barstar